MNNIEQIEKALITAGPGTIVVIDGYENSSGEVRNIRVELLGYDAYWKMQKKDLDILRDADVESLLGDEDNEVPSVADILTARDQMIDAKSASLTRHEAGEVDKRGPAYESIGGSLERLPADTAAIYLQRLKYIGDVEEPKPAKGAIPKAKQYLQRRLDLPSRRYLHSLKFSAGKFQKLEVERMVEGPSLSTNR